MHDDDLPDPADTPFIMPRPRAPWRRRTNGRTTPWRRRSSPIHAAVLS